MKCIFIVATAILGFSSAFAQGIHEENLSPLCINSKREKLWAQQRLDADIMNDLITARWLRSPSVHTPVIVIDTGFDPAHLKNMSTQVRIEPGVFGRRVDEGDGWISDYVGNPEIDTGRSLVGNPQKDTGGHGTMVASVIGGKDGIGVAPRAELTVYRVTKDDSGSTSEDFLNYAVHRACRLAKLRDPKSLPVINVSWGSRKDEMGTRRDEKEDGKLLRYLSRQGCLVVKAAGNASFRNHDSSVDGSLLDDSYLRVGATESLSGLANFSSSGEVQAPGENVYVLESSVAIHKADAIKQCGDENFGPNNPPKRFVNGTSFAAPLTAGIASELIGVLRSERSGRFEKLSNPQKIALVNRILKASTMAGSINGYRAVIIGDLWSKNPPSVLPSVDELQSLLTMNASDCSLASTLSLELTSVAFDDLRGLVARCSAGSSERALELFRYGLSNAAFETASKYYGVLKDAAKTRSSTIVDEASMALTQGYVDRMIKPEWYARSHNLNEFFTEPTTVLFFRYSLDATFGSEVLPDYLTAIERHPSPLTSAVALGLVTGLFEGNSFLEYMKRGPGRGSEEIMSSAINDLKALKNLVQPDEYDKTVRSIIDYSVNHVNPSAPLSGPDFAVTSARLIGALLRDESFSGLNSFLMSADDRLFKIINQTDFYFEKKTEAHVFFFENHATRAYFSDTLSRHTQEIRKALNERRYQDLSGLSIAYVVAYPSAFFDSTAASLAFRQKIRALLPSTPKWKKYRDEF